MLFSNYHKNFSTCTTFYIRFEGEVLSSCEPDVVDNEIATLRSPSDFNRTRNVNLACLPSATNDSSPSNHEKEMVVEWRQVSITGAGDEGSILQQAVLQTYDTSVTCDVRSQVDLKICAGRGATDGCDGKCEQCQGNNWNH